MYKKTVTYKGFDDIERTEDFYFHLSKADLVKMENSIQGGYVERMQKIIKAQNGPEISAAFEDLIKKSYGVKHEDGRRFVRNEQVYNEFAETEAYSIIYMELCTNAEAAAEFVNGIIPDDIQVDAAKLRELNPGLTPVN